MMAVAVYKLYTSGARIIDPIKKCKKTIHVVSYVDDNTLVQSLSGTGILAQIPEAL